MHNILTQSYPENVDKKKVQADWDHYAAMEDWQEGSTGVSPIRWLDTDPKNGLEKAEEYIREKDRGWYDCLAVRYYEDVVVKPTKSMENAKAAKNAAEKHYAELQKKINDDFFNARSATVGCAECGSKLNRKYLKKPTCPLCGRNLLSETATQRLMNAHDKIGAASAKVAQLYKSEKQKAEKAIKNRKVKWLVKIEYHT